MLVILLYHRVGNGRYSNPRPLFEQHLEYLASNYPVVAPGETKGIFQVSLTFDDATHDFAEIVFPLLEKFQLKATLAVPTALVGSRNHCSWSDLQHLAKSPLITIANHSMHHLPLPEIPHELHREVTQSKQMLQERLSAPVDTFIYPFGKFSPEVHSFVREHHRYAMRIGGAANLSWNQDLLYRINADELTSPSAPFSLFKLCTALCRYGFNRLRNK